MPPTPSFFSKIVTSTPAWRSRWAAAKPEIASPDHGAGERSGWIDVIEIPAGGPWIGTRQGQLLGEEVGP